MLPIRTAALLTALLAGATVAPAHIAQDQIELRWRGKVGDVLRHRITQKQSFEVSKMTQEMGSESVFVIRQEIMEVSPEGIGSLDLEYEALRMNADGPLSMSYDSTRKGEDAKENDPDLAAMFEPMLDAKLHMKIDPRGQILEVTGLSELLEEAFDQTENEAMAGTFKQMFSEDSLRRMLEVNVFPEQPLSAGDTWDRSLEMEMPPLGTMKLTFENELQGVERRGEHDCARIGVSAELELEGEVGESPIPMELSVDDSEIAGTMFFSLDQGYLIESSMEMSMDMLMSPEDPEMEMQMSLTSEMRMVRIGEDDPFFE